MGAYGFWVLTLSPELCQAGFIFTLTLGLGYKGSGRGYVWED